MHTVAELSLRTKAEAGWISGNYRPAKTTQYDSVSETKQEKRVRT